MSSCTSFISETESTSNLLYQSQVQRDVSIHMNFISLALNSLVDFTTSTVKCNKKHNCNKLSFFPDSETRLSYSYSVWPQRSDPSKYTALEYKMKRDNIPTFRVGFTLTPSKKDRKMASRHIQQQHKTTNKLHQSVFSPGTLPSPEAASPP
jgi:hypothetical protein